jgi:hypothetical protein
VNGAISLTSCIATIAAMPSAQAVAFVAAFMTPATVPAIAVLGAGIFSAIHIAQQSEQRTATHGAGAS